MKDSTAYMLQRFSAAILAPLVLIHLGLIIYAIEGGVSAEEILTRTQGSFLWPMLYLVFVAAVAIHAPLGLRNIMMEWTGYRRPAIDWIALAFFMILLFAGLRAVLAIL